MVEEVDAVNIGKRQGRNKRLNAQEAGFGDGNIVEDAGPGVPYACHRRQVAGGNPPGKSHRVGRKRYFDPFFVWRIDVVAHANRVAGKDQRHQRLLV